MARLIPNVAVESIALTPERTVAQALLRSLPTRTTVYHSYPWLRPERDFAPRGRLREGEADFVVVDPLYGLLVLEVKGGVIEYDSHTHLYHRQLGGGRRKEITQPFEQARRNKHALKGMIHQKLPPSGGHAFTFGYAVVFPDCNPSGGPPPGADPTIVLGARHLGSIGQRVDEIFLSFHGTKSAGPLPEPVWQAIQRGLSPVFQLLPLLYRIKEQEEALFRITEEQGRLLDFLGENDRVAIRGVAGSGKTKLANGERSAVRRSGEKRPLPMLQPYASRLAEGRTTAALRRADRYMHLSSALLRMVPEGRTRLE
jgi:hypothetical protein